MRAMLKNEYDTLTTRPERDPAYYLERHHRRLGRGRSAGEGRLARFREISRIKRVTIADLVAGRLDPIFDGEYRYYQWNVFALCVYCNRRLRRGELTRDHVIPRAQGGASTPDNLVPSCAPCNRAKGSKPLWRFLLERGRDPAAAAA